MPVQDLDNHIVESDSDEEGRGKQSLALFRAHCYAALEVRRLGPNAREDREHLHVKSGTKESTRVGYLLHSSYYVMRFLLPRRGLQLLLPMLRN